MNPLTELKAAFLEECEELLGALEERLSALRDGSDAADDINGAFRAIHSVKGGAGAFGLKSLVELAHVFEAALDHLRAGRISPRAAPYDLFLQGLDQVAALVSAGRRGEEASAPEELIQALKRIDPTQLESASAETAAAAPAAGGGVLRIALRPGRDLYRRAVDPRHVFAALEAFGPLAVTVVTDDLPPLDALDPMECRLAFDLVLESEAPAARVAEVIELHMGADEFNFGEAPKPAPPPAPLSAPSLTPAASPPEAPAATSSVPTPAPAVAAKPAATPEPSTPAEKPAAAARDAKAGEKPKATGSIRVDLDRIDRLMNLVGEIVITQSMLDQRLLQLSTPETMAIADGLQVLGRQTRELQDSVMAVRAQPVRNVFQRMPRLVRELGQSLGKQARLQIVGEDTEVDKTIIEELADPLTHMIRNAMDHGLEPAADRVAAGKPPEGVIMLRAEQRSGRIVISISDDGRGIDRDRLLAKARSRGLVGAEQRPSPQEIDLLLFHPGLSTAEAVSDVSGRGVGMDVVKQNVEALGGRVLVASEPGRGTRFTLLLPLTLAVMDGMIIRAAGHRLVLPIASIRETLRCSDMAVERLPGGQEYVRLRDRLSPLVRLGEVLGLGHARGEQVVVMAESEGGRQIGLFVDEIVGQQQVVVKSLEQSYGRVPGASAATILGDGLVALIVDVDAIPAMGVAPGGLDQHSPRPVLQ